MPSGILENASHESLLFLYMKVRVKLHIYTVLGSSSLDHRGHESSYVLNVNLLQLVHKSTHKSILSRQLVSDACLTFSINITKPFLY